MKQLIQNLIDKIKEDFPDLVEIDSVQAEYIETLRKLEAKVFAIEHLNGAIGSIF